LRRRDLLLGAAAAVLGGCGAPPRLPAGILGVAQLAEPESLDPHVTTSLNDFRILANAYEGLVRFRDDTLQPGPALATDWQVDPDGKAYTFQLRSGVTFHDGSPFDAEAVRYNFERLLDPGHPDHDTGPFPLASFFELVRSVEVPAAGTVRLILDQPFAPLLANMAYPTGFMVSPAAVRRHGKAYGRHPSGTGPFRVVEWTSRRRVVLRRNARYHGPPPSLDRVLFRPVADVMTRVAELLTGGVDMIPELDPNHVALLRIRAGFRIHEVLGPHLWFLILNTREGPFRDLRVRQAANLAVDKEALVRYVLQGGAAVAAGPVPAAFAWARDAAVTPYPHDPARARALMAEAGYASGADITLLVPQSGSGMLAPVPMATAIQADLARVGLRASIRTYEWNAYLAAVNGGLEGKADMAAMAWMTNDPDTLPYLALRSDATPAQGGFNSGYYANPAVDRLIGEGRRESDPEARAAYYRRLDRLVHDDAPWVFVASWRQAVVTRDSVRGFRAQPSFFLLLGHTRKDTAA